MSDMTTRWSFEEFQRLRATNAELLTVVKWCLEYDGGECLGDHPQRLRFAQTVALTASDAFQRGIDMFATRETAQTAPVIMERATEFVVVSDWAPIAGSEKTTGGLCYEDYTDLRRAEDAFRDYENGEYPRARAVCIFASRHGVPIGRLL